MLRGLEYPFTFIHMKPRSTIDAAEVRQFDSIGDHWWDENGPMRPLHRLNPLRLAYIRDALHPLKGRTVADIGCGGGLVAEPLARMGATVTGVDAGAENIRVAKAHAKAEGLRIEYLNTTAEDLVKKGRTFDAVTALEIVEHVADPALFLSSCCALVDEGGTLVLSTLNRSIRSYLFGIVAAERILRWLPEGTHDWRRFMKPSEVAGMLEEHGMEITDVQGLIYNPFTDSFAMSRTDLAVNYLMTAVKKTT
jgi:2-polyprenyl-6-hydroxyphenyl methylase / 3-demethylubiquinone-9 3-methyltransferase